MLHAGCALVYGSCGTHSVKAEYMILEALFYIIPSSYTVPIRSSSNLRPSSLNIWHLRPRSVKPALALLGAGVNGKSSDNAVPVCSSYNADMLFPYSCSCKR